MTSKLLTDTIKRMKLRPAAPYPTEQRAFEVECFDARQMILAWRRAQDKSQQLKPKGK
jgi:hypothetical protein